MDFFTDETIASNTSSALNHPNGQSHGWQKVTNSKKAKRIDPANPSRSKPNSSEPDNYKAFLALEKEAEQRRARKEALLLAFQQGKATPSSGAQIDSDLDDEDLEESQGPVPASNGEVEKKEKVKKPKKPKVSVVEASAAIDPSDLSSFLTEISESYGELPDVQLMRFADYFGRAFNQVTTTQFGWNKILKESSLVKALEVPLCYINEAVIKVANDWLAAKPLNALGDFFLWGLTDVINDIVQPHQNGHKGTKGAPMPSSSKTKVGVLVVLALTLRKRPEVVLQKVDVLRVSPQFQGQDKLPMLAWTYGQVAQGDLVVGMQVWVQNLLPLSSGKASSPASRDIALQFAETVLFGNLKKARPILQNGASRKGERLVPPTALHLLMQLTFPTDASRTKATERFGVIYPLVKELALTGPIRSKATRPVAQQLLPLCIHSACEDMPLELVREACSLFVWCLSQNDDCYKQWEKLHLEKLKGSIKVLRYICDEWKVVSNQLRPFAELKRAIDVIIAKNQVALEETKSDPKLESTLKGAEKHGKALKKKLTRTGPCFKATATLVAGVGIAYGFYLLKFDFPL